MKKSVSSIMPYVFFRGEIVPSENGRISIASHSLQYGTVVFAGIRGYWMDGKYRLFRPKDHFERLMNGAKILGMEFDFAYESFLGAIKALVAKNKPKTNFYIRPFIYSDDEIISPKFIGLNYDLAVYMLPMGDYLDTSKGLRLMISGYQKFSDCSISTKAKAGGAYLHASAARTDAIRCGYDEALVMNSTGNIVEGSAENLIMVYRDSVIVPDIGDSALEGISLRSALTILEDEGVPYRFGKIDRSMVYTCNELLLTGTAAQVLYAESVDGRKINEKPGPIFKKIRKAFDQILEMDHPRCSEWVVEFTI